MLNYLKGNVNDLFSTATTLNVRGIERLRALINGEVYELPIDSNGNFNTEVPIQPGTNVIQLRAWDNEGNARTSEMLTVIAEVERLDMRIVLTWDTVTDIDIHMVKREEGENNFMGNKRRWSRDRHVFYGTPNPGDFGLGYENPFLDIDVIREGYGPETIVLQEATPGYYHIWVHPYSLHEVELTNSQVDVIIDQGTAD